MIKYTGYAITFAEVPDETTLCFTISNCGCHCDGCHSPELQMDIGRDLEDDLKDLLNEYENRISCVCFMGQGNDPMALRRCFIVVKAYGLKAALYTGKEQKEYFEWEKHFPCNWDYLKLGHYDKEKGGLDSPDTNQIMIARMDNGEVEDITYRFVRRYK